MRNARFVKVSTRKGFALSSTEERGRGFGSVFRHHNQQISPVPVTGLLFFVPVQVIQER